MKRNMGKTDRIIRLILGLVLLANTYVGLQSPWGWIGLVLVVTAFVSYCPVYQLLKLDTRKTSEKIGLG